MLCGTEERTFYVLSISYKALLQHLGVAQSTQVEVRQNDRLEVPHRCASFGTARSDATRIAMFYRQISLLPVRCRRARAETGDVRCASREEGFILEIYE